MDKCKLSDEECVPCNGKTPPVSLTEAVSYLSQVPDWQIVDDADGLMLRRRFKFKTCAKAMVFINQMMAIAEQKNHHPVYVHGYKKVCVRFQTFAINNISKNDFILAALVDAIVVE
jgi:4a-hydroxytetrahydrobiopterin dehydratase